MSKYDVSTPIVAPDYIQDLYKMLEEMEVDLDENPLDFGPSRLSSKIQQCRQHLNIIETNFLEVSRKLHSIREKHRAAERLYRLEEDQLLLSDPEVRAGRSNEDRRSVARLKRPEMVAELTWMQQGMDDYQALLDALKYRQGGIKNTQSQLREQRNLCDQEIALGATWKNKHLPGGALQPGQGRKTIGAAVQDETNRIIADLEDGEIDLDALDTEETEAEEEDQASEEEEEDQTSEEEESKESQEDESPELAPENPEDDPSEKGTAEGSEVSDFLDSALEDEEGSSDSSTPADEELDIDDLLSGLT